MHCPYCVSDINDGAVVCPICRRDLYLFKPLLERIDVLEKQLAAQDGVLTDLTGASAGIVVEEAAGSRLEDETEVLPGVADWLSNWLAPLALLLLTHTCWLLQ